MQAKGILTLHIILIGSGFVNIKYNLFLYKANWQIMFIIVQQPMCPSTRNSILLPIDPFPFAQV